MNIRLLDDTDTADATPELLIHQLARAIEDEKEARQNREEIQIRVMDLLRSEHHKAKTVDNDFDETTRLRAVYVANRRTKIANEAGLKKAIGAAAFKKITEPKVSMTLLEQAVAIGTLDGNIVKQFIETTENPNVRLYVIDKRAETQFEAESAEG